jgi:hypothetical protein
MNALPFYTAIGTEHLAKDDPRIKAERLLSHAEAEAFVAMLEAKGHAARRATGVPVSARITYKDAIGNYAYSDGEGKVFTFAYAPTAGVEIWQVQLQPTTSRYGQWVAVNRIPHLAAARAA